jgi:hypothetical protein
MEHFINVFGEEVSKCNCCGMVFNGVVESCPNCPEDKDLRITDPEKYCKEICMTKQFADEIGYDRSTNEHPCFYCDIFG